MLHNRHFLGSLTTISWAQVEDIAVQDVPQTPMEVLRIFRNPESEDWERDYAAMMITSLDKALPEFVATARDPTVSEALQQRAAECLLPQKRS